MKTNPSVYVVTPVFNHIDHTLDFLRSMKKQTYRNLHVIIVDDGSTDGTADQITKKFPETTVLFGDGNLWWSGATNLGVKYALKAGADYILTINNDVTIKPGYTQSLVTCATEHPKALIGSMVLFQDDPERVWYCGAGFDQKRGELMHVTGRRPDFTDVRTSEWLTGMGVLIPAEAYQKAGLYDQVHCPQYFGDCEFSLRAKREGYQLLVNPKSEVYSDVSSSWVLRQVQNPKLSFWYHLYFSIRSPYQLKVRWFFYRHYWPRHYKMAMARLYLIFMWGLHLSFVLALIKKWLGLETLRPSWARKTNQ